MTATTPRADAQRNRAKVLAAAEELFATRGLAVPLDEIARCAGVGAGTVYRHFPTKDALLEAVMTARIVQLAADAQAALTVADPVAAFFDFLVHTMERARLNTALCDAIRRDDDWRTIGNPDLRCRFQDAMAQLLARAQDAGAVRTDITIAEVTALVPGYVAMAGFAPNARVKELLLDALRPRVVPSRNSVTFHNGETDRPSDSHETPRCVECGTALREASTGRPAKYCGPACRQKAHRRRATTAADGRQHVS
ncbi:MAG TPA: helix-turn-helix domain-containing protein [Stackebrandtia sp.]|uniref:TetR/AcrR family transcriptional regulator n=1 Tax=Stackebrandtia sp. TaxID=2023065 RepID=UPI002D34C0DF|nr:helix-turn-helix domain-containing protein [Stackebrandtia sp.]HZE38442.1 helix-turn-helix domain-containing protein [Stackebrandtia sp.]